MRSSMDLYLLSKSSLAFWVSPAIEARVERSESLSFGPPHQLRQGSSQSLPFAGLILEELVCLLDAILQKSPAFVTVDLVCGIEFGKALVDLGLFGLLLDIDLGKAFVDLGLLGEFLLNSRIDFFLVFSLLTLEGAYVLTAYLNDGLESFLLGFTPAPFANDHLIGLSGIVRLGSLGILDVFPSFADV